MINQFDFKIKELENMKKIPKELYFIGNTQLLKRKKISIVGQEDLQIIQKSLHIN